MNTSNELSELITHLSERFVLSFEKIASALEGINETYRRQHARQYPERGQVREAIVTRVPSQEDKVREDQQGSEGKTLMEWLSESPQERSEENGDIGHREQEWINRQKHHAGAPGDA